MSVVSQGVKKGIHNRRPQSNIFNLSKLVDQSAEEKGAGRRKKIKNKDGGNKLVHLQSLECSLEHDLKPRMSLMNVQQDQIQDLSPVLD